MAAQYLVVRQPGAYVEHRVLDPETGKTKELYSIGFVRFGQFFYAPHPDYEPSRHMRAMNAEAVKGLDRLKAKLKKYDEERAALLKDKDGNPLRDLDGRSIRPPVLANDVNTDLWEAPQVIPVVGESGLSVRELGELSDPKKKTEAGLHLDTKAQGKRVADR